MKSLFLDWGSTLVLARHQRTVVDADGNPVLMPGVAEVLARERPGFDCCFIVSNQARIGRGEISESEVLRRFGRKPRPGMFLELAGRFGVDLAASLHVGDSDKDREAAARAGVGTFAWARDFFGWGRAIRRPRPAPRV